MKFLLDHDVPEGLEPLLGHWGFEVMPLADGLAHSATDAEVFHYAGHHHFVIVTCNRRDFLPLAENSRHPGLIILVRRKSRHREYARLFALLKRAEEPGITGKVNFA